MPPRGPRGPQLRTLLKTLNAAGGKALAGSHKTELEYCQKYLTDHDDEIHMIYSIFSNNYIPMLAGMMVQEELAKPFSPSQNKVSALPVWVLCEFFDRNHDLWDNPFLENKMLMRDVLKLNKDFYRKFYLMVTGRSAEDGVAKGTLPEEWLTTERQQAEQVMGICNRLQWLEINEMVVDPSLMFWVLRLMTPNGQIIS